MSDEQLEMLVMSYGLGGLLNLIDMEPVEVLRLLIEYGDIDEEDLRELYD